MTDLEMTPILKTHDQGLLAVIESVLNGAEAAGLLPLNATIVVPAAFAEQASKLLKEAQEAHEPVE